MYNDFLVQAGKLARLDPRRPKQANPRRAISSAYYAFFHFLVDQSCRSFIGTQQSKAAYRHTLARAFVHADMRAACESFAGGTLKKTVSKGLPPAFSIAPETRRLAEAFLDLQRKRHTADYDLTERFTRSEVFAFIREARIAIRRFRRLPRSDEKKFFLLCLLAWKTLANR